MKTQYTYPVLRPGDEIVELGLAEQPETKEEVDSVYQHERKGYLWV